MEIEPGKLPPPPGLISSMTRGFDAVANHFPVILPPLLLDLFLWLGPRLRLNETAQALFASSMDGIFPIIAGNGQATQLSWAEIASQINLFANLRTFPVGIPSLLVSQVPLVNPLGEGFSLDAGSLVSGFGWMLLLLVLGWVLGGLYYFWVAGVAVRPEKSLLGRSVFQSVLLSAIWAVALFFFGFPILLILLFLLTTVPEIGQVVLFAGAMALTWLVMPIFFSAHGIFTFQLDALRSILNSLRVVRFTLPNMALFLLTFVVVNQGLGFLWIVPEQDSWWLLVGIGGHAFVSTALLAASFIYYSEINSWLKVVFEQLQKQTTTIAKA